MMRQPWQRIVVGYMALVYGVSLLVALRIGSWTTVNRRREHESVGANRTVGLVDSQYHAVNVQ